MFWGISFIVAFLMNVYGIVRYNTSWSELYSQLHIVLLISFVLYAFIGIIRLSIFGILKVFRKTA
ncbi:hypothetical protein CLV93_103233 [Prolixibacter denitrificans]|uniref:Uncharacterized protein n=2 Tax=Prolixibacter denitrificans TaxID=1541063 RepID=A0A2P8CFQ7_9BACT|nr:hypothetical protein CLV93_103233 [Prolixibacter denitrificans]GET23359.1 hypothetical protein JCM18694_36050 [Prolixibacter denitrificans]